MVSWDFDIVTSLSESDQHWRIWGSDTPLFSHHLPDHHDVRPGLLIDSQDIQQTHIPEDNVQTVNDPARDKHVPRAEAQAEAHEEHQDRQKIRNVEVVAEPDFNLLTDFASFRHEHLERKHKGTDDDTWTRDTPDLLTPGFSHMTTGERSWTT